MKSQRIFWMQVQGASNLWTITSPITLELDIEQGAMQSLSNGTFKIYNLSKNTRSDIYQDVLQQGDLRQINVRAGYYSWTQINTITQPVLTSTNIETFLNQLPIIFSGNIVSAQSQRHGSDWITTIEAWDGGYGVTQSDVNIPITAGTTIGQILTALVNAMPSVTVGFIDPKYQFAKYKSQRGKALAGSPWDLILGIADFLYADAYIFQGKFYILPKGQFIPGIVPGLVTITSSTGLIETPTKQNNFVSFSMIFEPRLTVGQPINLESLETVNNGLYAIAGISHSGTISDAVAGDLITTVQCMYPSGAQPYGAIQG